MRKLVAVMALLVGIQISSVAQEQILPGGQGFDFSLSAFSADYVQMGRTLSVNTSTSADGKVYNVVMSMPDFTNPSRIITDIVGISNTTGAFLYRDFHLPLPSWSYNRVEHKAGNIIHQSFGGSAVATDSTSMADAVFDGTFAYWQLAGVSQSVNGFSLNRWKATPQGLVAGLSPEFKYERRQELTVGEQTFTCRVFSVEAAPGTKIINYISNKAPYLIRQEMERGSSPAISILELKGLNAK